MYLFGFSHTQQLVVMFWRLVWDPKVEPSSGPKKTSDTETVNAINMEFLLHEIRYKCIRVYTGYLHYKKPN